MGQAEITALGVSRKRCGTRRLPPRTTYPEEQAGALLVCTRGSACRSLGLGHCAYSLPGLGRKQRQEAILGPVISLLPGPFWAGLLCRLAMCGCVCARLNEYRQPAPATACRASSSQG